AQAVGENTRAGWIVRTVQQAPEHDTRAADYAEQVADRLVMPTVALALLSLAATRDAARAAAILNVDFTTGIDLSAPTSFLTTMDRAARQGVLIKSGRAIECLATADAVVFDKTGTVTHGRPEVAEGVSLGDRCSPIELLALAAAAEVNLRHLIGQAIVRHARRLRVALPVPESMEVSPRLGVLAEVDGHRVRVGSYRFLAEAGFRMDQADAHTSRLRHEGQSAAWVAVDDALVGFIAYHDPPRVESAAVVAWLRAHGVPEIHLATGDGPMGAQAVARALDITEVHAAALPEDKAAVVQQLQQAGHVVIVVGDGVDDAPALALANVSVSLAHGAD